MLGMMSIPVFAIGIEVAKSAYFTGGSIGFSAVNLVCGLLWLWLVRKFLREGQRRKAIQCGDLNQL